MTKLVLDDVTSGFNITKINDNFEKISSELQNKVLYRDNTSGEANAMRNALDMNSNPILNLPTPSSPTSPVRLIDITSEFEDLFQTQRVEVFNGGASSYALLATPNSISSVQVFVDGVAQYPDIDFTLEGAIVTPIAPFPTGLDNVMIRYGIAIDTSGGGEGGGSSEVVYGGASHGSYSFSSATPATTRHTIVDTLPSGWNVGKGTMIAEFDIKFVDYFAANPGGHVAVVIRADTDVIATDVRGNGMLFGNVSGAPEGPSHAPTSVLETWYAGLGAPAGQRFLFPFSDGDIDKPLVDNVQYKVILSSSLAEDGNMYIRYKLYRYNDTYMAWDLERDTGDFKDDNVWADFSKSGLVFAHVFNDDLVPWSVNITNARTIWGPARLPATAVRAKTSTSGFNGIVDSDLTFVGNARRQLITSNATSPLSNNFAFQDKTVNANTTVLAIPSGTSKVASFGAFSDSALTSGTFVSMSTTATHNQIDSDSFGGAAQVPLHIRQGTAKAIGLNSGIVEMEGNSRSLRINGQQATLNHRFAIQEYNTNAPTTLILKPNGTGTSATVLTTNKSDLSTAAATMSFGVVSGRGNLSTFSLNGAAEIPIDVVVGAATAFTVQTTGQTHFNYQIKLPSSSSNLGSDAGWSAWTGTAWRFTQNADSFPASNFGEHANYIVGIMRTIKALIDDLKARKVI